MTLYIRTQDYYYELAAASGYEPVIVQPGYEQKAPPAEAYSSKGSSYGPPVRNCKTSD